MAFSSFRNPTFSSSLGSGFGTGLGVGLGSGLQALAEARLNRLHKAEAAQERVSLANTLQELGFAPSEATFVAQLPPNQQFQAFKSLVQAQAYPNSYNESPQSSPVVSQLLEGSVPQSSLLANPINLGEMLKGTPPASPVYNQSQLASPVMPPAPFVPQEQPAPLSPTPIQATPEISEKKLKKEIEQPKKKGGLKEALQNQYLAKDELALRKLKLNEQKLKLEEEKIKKGEPKTEAEKKREEEMRSVGEDLLDILETADRMIKITKSPNFSPGFLASKTAEYAPNWLSNANEEFDKDSAHIINLLSRDLPGTATNFKVKLLQKEKPSLEHSVSTNKKILERIVEKAKEKYNLFKKLNPTLELSSDYNNQSSGFSDLPDAALYKGKRIEDTQTGSIFISDGMQWRKQ